MPYLSAAQPNSAGIIAPPTIAVMISPDPLLVIGPSPAMPSVKMLGNMMELKKPHRTMVQMATLPEVDMDVIRSAEAANPKIPSSLPDFTFVRIHEPSRRPTSAPNQ